LQCKLSTEWTRKTTANHSILLFGLFEKLLDIPPYFWGTYIINYIIIIFVILIQLLKDFALGFHWGTAIPQNLLFGLFEKLLDMPHWLHLRHSQRPKRGAMSRRFKARTATGNPQFLFV